MSYLHFACVVGNMGMVARLLDSGLDLSETMTPDESFGGTDKHLVADCLTIACYYKHCDLVYENVSYFCVTSWSL